MYCPNGANIFSTVNLKTVKLNLDVSFWSAVSDFPVLSHIIYNVIR